MPVMPVKKTVLFSEDGFASGRWAAGLRKELAEGVEPAIMPDWNPRTLTWRGDYQQWVQFQPSPGPFFWSGKPAVVSSPHSLYAGYYVERGLSRSDYSERVMGPAWHWNGFIRVICEEAFLRWLNPILARLPESRRCIWVLKWPDSAAATKKGRDFAVDDLPGLRAYLDPAFIAPNQWIDVIVGVRYGKDECINLQYRTVEQIIPSLRQARELYNLVSDAVPR